MKPIRLKTDLKSAFFVPPPSVHPRCGRDADAVFAGEMGRRYRENGDGWDSMCRAADKLSLINGFSPGHLISLALSLKSNLTLCMSVNINKPSTLHSNVIYCVAHGARQESQFDGEDSSSVCLKWGQRGEKSRQILLSFQTSINTDQV